MAKIASASAKVGKIGKLIQSSDNTTIYPVTIGDAVVVEKERLTSRIKKINLEIAEIQEDVNVLKDNAKWK